jgi:NTP pyrophosphatase (non-canonical NTP hydrolase)
MTKSDVTLKIQQLKDAVTHFRDERGWRERNNAKNLAVSLVLEAAELLEHFQWDDSTEDEMKTDKKKKQEIAYEMADCFVYLLAFAERMDIDIATAVLKKLKLTAKKYPLSHFNRKHQDIEYYYQVKKKYRGEK